MRHNRARARQIRTLMAATGQPFTLASRALDQGGSSYLRTKWNISGWSRLLPRQAMNLEMVIGTATVTGQDGDLAALVAAHPISTRYPDGLDTTLIWHDHDADDEIEDEDTKLASAAQTAFSVAVTASGRPVPTTLTGLAELLTDLGVYQHTLTGAGTHRWRAAEDLPDPIDVLPLPADWITREEQIRWASQTLGPATALARGLQSRHLDDARYGQDSLDTTLQRLASDADMPVEVVRDGLDGLMYRAELTVQRQGVTLARRDLTTLAEHARIQLVIDWPTLESTFGDPDETKRVVWEGPPWRIFRSIADDRHMGDHAFVIGLMQFRIRKPTGGSFITCLDIMAQQQGISVAAAASSLIELDEAGLLRWRVDEQVAELAERPDQFSDA
jgi:hypothetical protein